MPQAKKKRQSAPEKPDGSGNREQIGRERINQKDDTESADDYFGMSVGTDALRCAAVDGREPVSYTHLDVYKRQGYFPF